MCGVCHRWIRRANVQACNTAAENALDTCRIKVAKFVQETRHRNAKICRQATIHGAARVRRLLRPKIT